MAREVPKSLKVVGHKFKVGITTDPDFNEQFHGVYHRNPPSITLASRNHPALMRETLLHELIHAISDAFHSEMNEQQVDTTARGLYAVLRDNPKLVKFITE